VVILASARSQLPTKTQRRLPLRRTIVRTNALSLSRELTLSYFLINLLVLGFMNVISGPSS
jgi:hypothetical protein